MWRDAGEGREWGTITFSRMGLRVDTREYAGPCRGAKRQSCQKTRPIFDVLAEQEPSPDFQQSVPKRGPNQNGRSTGLSGQVLGETCDWTVITMMKP